MGHGAPRWRFCKRFRQLLRCCRRWMGSDSQRPSEPTFAGGGGGCRPFAQSLTGPTSGTASCKSDSRGLGQHVPRAQAHCQRPSKGHLCMPDSLCCERTRRRQERGGGPHRLNMPRVCRRRRPSGRRWRRAVGGPLRGCTADARARQSRLPSYSTPVYPPQQAGLIVLPVKAPHLSTAGCLSPTGSEGGGVSTVLVEARVLG